MQFLPLLTFMSAIAVYDVLSEFYDLKPDIKWANDIHVDGRKVCGILAESVETSKGLAVIVGIGINVKSSNFPSELNEIAVSIQELTNETPKLEDLLRQLTGKLSQFYKIINEENGAGKIREEWIKRSTYAFNKEVKAVLTDETIIGKTCGIEENGALRIEQANGKIAIIQAGDVEMLRKIPNSN